MDNGMTNGRLCRARPIQRDSVSDDLSGCRRGVALSGLTTGADLCPVSGKSGHQNETASRPLLMLWTAPALRHRSGIDWLCQS
jgi:hypothetical protein